MHLASQTIQRAFQYYQAGDLRQAEFLCGQILQNDPWYVDALHLFGVIAHQVGRNDLAVDYIQRALRLHPAFPDAYNNLGTALMAAGMPADAQASYLHALRLRPDFAEAHSNLGNVQRDLGKLDESIASCREALRLKPNYADAHNNLGAALTELGRIAEASASVREALRLNPRHANALWQLTRLLGGKLPEADRVLLERRVAEPDLNDTDRAKLLFGLAQVCDAQSEYERAAPLLRQANALMAALAHQQGLGYDPDGDAHQVDNLIAAFSPAFFERARGFGLETERPVFIVGLPRSGTTLTEQILAAHSQVFSGGELLLAREDFLALGTLPTEDSAFASLPGLPGDALRRQAQRHLDQLGAINRTATRFVDKMPENFMFLGLLAALFPRAKFIHCRRDLRDVAMSCWMTHFERLPWANDPEHIAARIRQYQRLMDHWQKVLPAAMLEIQYEETVADLPGVARRLLAWCGLDWEPACLAFHESKKPVRTASAVQVRQPIHANSVARWRHYERELGPLFAACAPNA